jgi:predicted RNA-binding Zn-ribbon protein involved in translation (DUF1610 family)
MAPEQTAPTTETCPACGAIIDTTENDPLARVPCPKCGEKVRVQRAFNNFELVETVGVGGMGTVYKATDTLLDRFVALKLLRKDLGDEIDYATRLQQEARVAASVSHPNVIQVFSSGKDHGQFYLVMELVDHGSLDDLIEQRKSLPEEQVVEAGIQVAKGLRAAHAKGLIHRDVKPANILFADEHTAKIGDFGLAGVAAETGEGRREIWGTPYYVAPERLNNQPEDLRSDIYSLGATLFHAISGRAPIEGDTNSATALRELKNSPMDLREVAPEVSERTASVLQRMIAPDPAKRFSSYDELVDALENAHGVLTGKGDARGTPWLAAGISILVALAIAVGAVVFVRSSRKAVPAAPAGPVIAVAELERQAGEARHELVINHYNKAGAQFARIAGEARGKQPLYGWARMQQALAAMVGRENSQARQALQDVENAGQAGFGKSDADLAKFFTTTAKRLLAPGVVPGVEAAQKSATNFESFALFPLGLKDVDQGAAAEAIPFFEQFVNAKPAGNFAWIGELKPLAQKYLDDSRLYLAWKNQPAAAGTPADPAENLARVRDLKKKLKTRSALSDEVNAQEKTLAARAGDLQKTEQAAHAQERKKLLDVQAPSWNAALANYRQKVMVYDFSGARDAISAAKVSEPGLRDAQTATLKKAQWLVDWKTKLMEDLNRTHFIGAVSDTAGTPYTGIDGATAQAFAMKVPYGSVQVPWIKLAPKTLVGLSSYFIKPTAADVADRQWLSAAFAAETGQTDAARTLAEAAAKAKPEYRNQIPLLLPPPGSSR